MLRLTVYLIQWLTKSLLVAIIFSLIAAFFVWFVWTVLLSGDQAFLGLWRWAYIGIAGLLLVRDILTFPIKIWLVVAMSKQYQVSRSDVAHALFKRHLTREEGYRKWSPDEFRQWLLNAEIGESFARSVRRFIRKT